MEYIDLDAIQLKYINSHNEIVYPTKKQVSEMMKEAIHQALLLASEKAVVKEEYYGEPLPIEHYTVDKQSILDVEKLIK